MSRVWRRERGWSQGLASSEFHLISGEQLQRVADREVGGGLLRVEEEDGECAVEFSARPGRRKG